MCRSNVVESDWEHCSHCCRHFMWSPNKHLTIVLLSIVTFGQLQITFFFRHNNHFWLWVTVLHYKIELFSCIWKFIGLWQCNSTVNEKKIFDPDCFVFFVFRIKMFKYIRICSLHKCNWDIFITPHYCGLLLLRSDRGTLAPQ